MKELHTGMYFWNTFPTKQIDWPKLNQSHSTKVLIVGGGMSGLLSAFMLFQHNIDFILLEANEIAEGSSLASTGLLQYSNDIMLSELRSQIGRQKADTFYRYCFYAMEQLKKLSGKLIEHTGDTQFRPRSSMQYNSIHTDIVKLQNEYAALSSINLPCELWGKMQIEEHFPFSKDVGLITHGDAEVNPFLCVNHLANYLTAQGCHLYEHSSVTDMTSKASDHHIATVNHQYQIEAQYVIYAVGYQPKQLHQKLFKPILNRSYVIVTNPVNNLSVWYEKYMLWESARPYLYCRTTVDSRIVVGGLDETSQTPNHDASSTAAKYNQLLCEIKKLFPSFDLTIEYSWNATFAESADQLPYLGVDPSNPHIMYVLGYGGNGTVFSILGAELLTKLILGSDEMNDLAEVVKLDR